MLAETKVISFPLGIAKDEYFCNRVQETKQLLRNIKNSIHTVLISPRRYGKTSLAYKAIKESRLPSARIDLYMSTSPQHIEKAIIAGIDHILYQVNNNAEVLLRMMKGYIKLLKPSFEASPKGFKIKLETSAKTSSSANICEAFQILDVILKKKRLKAVLLIDEFQEVHVAAPNQGIEGAIRHIAQETKNFTIIFSGSRRNLLRSMFNNKNQPLYRLCDEIHLERINENDYKHYLQDFAQTKWAKKLDPSCVDIIFEKTERHPYYFHALCEKVFLQDDMPNENTINMAWQNLILSKKKDILSETKDLSMAQKKLLVAICHGIQKELTSQSFLAQAELSGATVLRALDYLEENDFIEKSHHAYCIIDPLLKSVIKDLTYF